MQTSRALKKDCLAVFMFIFKFSAVKNMAYTINSSNILKIEAIGMAISIIL